MNEATSTTFALKAFMVDGVHVDPSALRLSSSGVVSTLEPKVMALLVTLAQRPGQLWTRADLLDEIWPTGLAGDESLSRLVSLLRKTMSVNHGLDEIVTTVPKLGYRLDAAVSFDSAQDRVDDEGPSPARNDPAQGALDQRTNTANTTTDRPRRRLWPRALLVAGLIAGLIGLAVFSIDRASPADTETPATLDLSQISMAVLPIEDLDGNEGRSFLAEGMTRDLTAAFSQVPSARVAPYSSTRLLSGSPLDGASAARDLDVRYVISGAMTVEREQLVLRIDLTDAEDNRQIWSKRFSEPLANFFDLQEKVIEEIAASIFSEIQSSEIASLRQRDDFNLTVYELIQKAESERYGYGREAAKRIVSHLERALEIDPDSYSARAALAIQLAQNVISGFSDDPERDIPLALQYLDEVRAMAPRDPRVLQSAAMVQYYLNGDMEQGRRLLEQSLEIDPNEPHAAVILGLIQCYSGQTGEGLMLIRNSETRAPRDPRIGIWAWFRAACHSVDGDITKAERAAAEAIDRNPNFPAFHYALASYKCLLGNKEEARAAVQRARRLDIEFGQQDYERLLSTAGFPGIPDKSRDQVFKSMRACLAGN